jgi:hypothetical protein
MQKVLIGIAGKAGSGKDTAADYLKRYYGFKGVAFADPIRDGMKAIIGLDDYHFSHPTKEVILPEFGKSPRQMMQTLGTEWGRQLVNQDLWLILAGLRKSEWNLLGHDVVITDVRFENEATWVRENGGTIWHILRGKSVATAHASEAGIYLHPLVDEVIDNSGTLPELYLKVVDLYNKAVSKQGA